MNTQQICLQKMNECKILFTYSSKNKKQKQLYTVDTSREILIGGLNETGYMLKIWPENISSHTCMTYANILRVLAGKTITQHVFEVRLIN